MDMKKNRSGRRQKLSAILSFLAAAVVALGGCGEKQTAATDSTQIELETEKAGNETAPEGQDESGKQDVEPGLDGKHTGSSGGETQEQPAEETPVSGRENGKTPVADSGPLPKAENGRWLENIMLGTDIHYFSDSLTDGGPRFQEMVEYGDGKMVDHIDEITDAFLDEVVKLRPDVLVLSGDLTLNGEKASHKDLAEKLHRVENHGIPVLVIPGNHDINNRQAACYKGDERMPAEYTTPREFREIYKAFGYDEAASEDPASLSYLYELDDHVWLLMIDSCQYDPIARVGGGISEATYEWIEEQLEAAADNDARIIPIAHHNLLDESEIYIDECTIEHSEQFVELLEDWDVPLFLSGHLHVQHYKRSDENRGIWEMVTSSLATPACKYSILTYRDDDSFLYRTRSLDAEQWSGASFLRRVFYNQAMRALNRLSELTETEKEQMSRLYSLLKYHYYQGTAYQVQDAVRNDPAYEMWQEEGAPTQQSEYFQYILDDGVQDYNRLESD